jgi:5'-nucleotidase
MFKAPLDLSRSRILITNDDGIRAPGLEVLRRVARKLSKDVWVIAPETEQSAASHSLTLRRPLRIRRISSRRLAVDGTPTDCVLLAINHVLRDRPPDLILSGVNRGANLGEDVTYSGTIAAAMEGTLMGVPSIAFSQLCEDNHPVKWSTAEQFAPEIITRLVAAPWPKNMFVNVNFPDLVVGSVRGIEVTAQGRRKIGDELIKRTDPSGEDYYWIGSARTEEARVAGTDLNAVLGGAISVTPLHLDLTHRPTMRKLRRVFDAPDISRRKLPGK